MSTRNHVLLYYFHFTDWINIQFNDWINIIFIFIICLCEILQKDLTFVSNIIVNKWVNAITFVKSFSFL